MVRASRGPSRIMLIDLHVHSHLTKGVRPRPARRPRAGCLLGLDGVAFTETNTQDGCDELVRPPAQDSPCASSWGWSWSPTAGSTSASSPARGVPEPVQLWGSNREKPWSAVECVPRCCRSARVVVAARPYDRDFPTPGAATRC